MCKYLAVKCWQVASFQLPCWLVTAVVLVYFGVRPLVSFTLLYSPAQFGFGQHGHPGSDPATASLMPIRNTPSEPAEGTQPVPISSAPPGSKPFDSSWNKASDLTTWKKKTFCHDFLVDTFHDKLPMCGGSEVRREDQVKCSGTVYSNLITTCSYFNLALNPEKMKAVIPSDVDWKVPKERTVNLLQSTGMDCKSTSVIKPKNGFQRQLTAHLLKSEKLPTSVCDMWINKTTFFHVSNKLHIYFRFLDLYDVHKALFDYGATEGSSQVLRIGSMGTNYRFPAFDKALFPGALTLDDLQANATVCFREAIFVPISYQSLPFRCKMEPVLRKRCFECNGKGLTGSPLHSFRSRVLKACNITEHKQRDKSQIVIVSRKPYKRWSSDKSSNFERVLTNEDDMVAKIQTTFPSAEVTVLHMEELDVCEQVQYAEQADVMLGVHGAGLVHFWWLRDTATALELEPGYEIGNPSFKMLTTLAGRKYVSEKISGRKSVQVNIPHLLQTLKKIFATSR